MDYKFYACPPMAGTHQGWFVDGVTIPLTFPAAFPAGFKLTVAFAYRPKSTVYAKVSHVVDGQLAYTMHPATYEE